MRYIGLLLVGILLAPIAQASYMYSFARITNNSSANAGIGEAQLTMEVAGNGS